MGSADRAPIATTSIFSGAFMDMLGAQMPIIQPRVRRILHWGDHRQLLNFTTRDDVASYTARVALDDHAPRSLRIAGATMTVDDIAASMFDVTGLAYHTLRVGSVRSLGLLIRATQLVAPEKNAVFPGLAGDAVHARPVHRPGPAATAGQRPLPRPDLDPSTGPASGALRIP
jgi:hypothetical protein